MPIGCELDPFLSTVKCAPGDWFQISSTMKTRKDATVGQIEAHVRSIVVACTPHLLLTLDPIALHSIG